nr:MAG TPA: hypothetical protein [Caudoviricetes sp.]
MKYRYGKPENTEKFRLLFNKIVNISYNNCFLN